MGHFSSMVVFAFFVSVVFSLLSKETIEARWKYFFRLFAAFVGISIIAAWVMYPFPF
jgi:hypothetical protein